MDITDNDRERAAASRAKQGLGPELSESQRAELVATLTVLGVDLTTVLARGRCTREPAPVHTTARTLADVSEVAS